MKAYWEAQLEVDLNADPAWLSLVVELKAERKAIGQVGLGVIRSGEQRQGTIGWLLGRQYQGQGLATEAARALMTYGFDHLGLHRIAARTGSDNERSWRLMERIGMRREAHLVVLHFAAEAVGGELRACEETTEAGYFGGEEIEQMEMSGFNRQRVADGFAVRTATPVREDFSPL